MLEGQEAEISLPLANAEASPPRLRQTADATSIYRARVADLDASLNAAKIRMEIADAQRQLIEVAVLTPDAPALNALAALPHGELVAILTLAAAQELIGNTPVEK